MADRIAGLIVNKSDTDQRVAGGHRSGLLPACAAIIGKQNMAKLTDRDNARSGARHIEQKRLSGFAAGNGIFARRHAAISAVMVFMVIGQSRCKRRGNKRHANSQAERTQRIHHVYLAAHRNCPR